MTGPLLPVIILAVLSLKSDFAIADQAKLLSSSSAQQKNDSLLWGPYRPNLYFGIKPRIPQSFLGGLMWTRVDDFTSLQQNFRHTCEQSDQIHGYGWDEFDARNGGIQNIYDEGNGIDITTSFVKIPGGAHGGNWAARIRGKVRKGFPQTLRTTTIFYASLEGIGSLEVQNKGDLSGVTGDVTLTGDSQGIGGYNLVISTGSGKHPQFDHAASKLKPLDRTFINSIRTPGDLVWQTKEILFQKLQEQVETYLKDYGQENPPPPSQMYTIPHQPGDGNLHLVQKVFEGDFEFDVVFESGSSGKKIRSSEISELIEETSKDYWQKFTANIDLQPPFETKDFKRFGSSMFSNLVGGLGYFYGDSVVDRSYASEYDEENEGFWEDTAAARARKQEKLEGPAELFTTVPSRPFFPRGFLWDEGFHLLLVIDWDIDLTLEVIKSWFNLMDDDGWIGREQILGAEARSKVPTEFQVQYPHYANPPTLFLIIDALVEKVNTSRQTLLSGEARQSETSEEAGHLDYIIEDLRELYPKLEKHYRWYRETQAGDLKSYDRTAFSSIEAYRWRGRSQKHILTSGLDDYPRPQPPHPGELHVDLISWMGMMTKSLRNVAEILDQHDDATELAAIGNAIVLNIDDLHWSESHKCYCDATIDDYEENVLVCHKGYISIFPFLTGLLDERSEKLGHILNLIENKDELWSDYGIRSLSKTSEFYGTDENYWRGPIWMNINYLIVTQLLKIAQTPGPYQEKCYNLYGRLRLNLVQTVFNSWSDTGFAWEQYNPENGKGQRTQHFTGWTSLVVKIMTLPHLDSLNQPADISTGSGALESSHNEL
ncbi:mannosyl-oligosaccharide glucosidase [Blumeria hordei DH14]|uniref:Mannosyl-oligosaccharide glucosidase n=1 Tax=Blumeria graminis f. sp. hordei (strain DH14) TaxID=546991 RepID=N1JCC5_BLUG1|nr:mannosyl-oligosaccharide glucosidase [Blumeria hordei DH14]